MRAMTSGRTGSFKDAAGAISAASTAGSHAAVELQLVEALAAAVGMALDVPVGNTLADANNHVDHSRPRLRADGSHYK